MSRWIAAGIGIFWSIRTALQWCYYGHGHWVGKPRETAVHWILTVGYSVARGNLPGRCARMTDGSFDFRSSGEPSAESYDIHFRNHFTLSP